jgi:hypothetical protein
MGVSSFSFSAIVDGGPVAVVIGGRENPSNINDSLISRNRDILDSRYTLRFGGMRTTWLPRIVTRIGRFVACDYHE